MAVYYRSVVKVAYGRLSKISILADKSKNAPQQGGGDADALDPMAMASAAAPAEMGNRAQRRAKKKAKKGSGKGGVGFGKK